MSQPSTTDRLAAFIAQRLAKQADLGGRTVTAIAETEKRFNDSTWFWTDDNAKMAELFCGPDLRDRYPALADATVDFVLRMSRGRVIQRRCGPPELQVVSADPKAFRIRTAFFNVEGDLSLGVLRPSIRFNDGRGQEVVHYTGNMVEFTHKGRHHLLDVENCITAYAVEPGEDAAVLSHTSTLTVPVGTLPGLKRTETVGTLRYEYTIYRDRAPVRLRVRLVPAAGVRLDKVVLSTAMDNAGAIVEFRQLCVGTQAGYRTVDTIAGKSSRTIDKQRGKSNRARQAFAGAASYVAAIQQGGSPGFSYANHWLLPSGDKLREVRTTCHVEGRLHWMVLKYDAGGTDGTPLEIEEERLLTAGGYYDDPAHYAAVMRADSSGGEDPSMTYDIGAELNAVAVLYLFGSTGRYAGGPLPLPRLIELRSWYDRHLDRYFEFLRPGEAGEGGRTFGRGLAFVAMSLDCMLRATGEGRYRDKMAVALDVLMRLFNREQVGDDTWEGAFIDTWTGTVPFLDVHAAGMLALARCAAHGDPGGRYAQALAEAIMEVKLTTLTVTPGPGARVYCDQLGVKSRAPEKEAPHEDTGYWNFKMGLLLRALKATARATELGTVALPERPARRLPFLVGLGEQLIGLSLRDHGDMLEVLTSHRSGETNSETQPWVALGLDTSLDEAIRAVPVPA